MEDYKEKIKQMLLAYFATSGNKSSKLYYSTSQVLAMVQGVIPQEPINEHDIFEVLTELGFQQELRHVFKKDEDGNTTDVLDFSVYLWRMYLIIP